MISGHVPYNDIPSLKCYNDKSPRSQWPTALPATVLLLHLLATEAREKNLQVKQVRRRAAEILGVTPVDALQGSCLAIFDVIAAAAIQVYDAGKTASDLDCGIADLISSHIYFQRLLYIQSAS